MKRNYTYISYECFLQNKRAHNDLIKMNLKIIAVSLLILKFEDVLCDCDSYFECVGDFFQGFFFGDPEETEVRTQTYQTNSTEVKNINFSDLDAVLKDISEFLNEEVKTAVNDESDNVFKTVKSETKIYIKAFDFEDNIENEKVEVATKLPEAKKYDNTKNADSILEEGIKRVDENEISDDKLYMTYYDDVDDNSTDYPAIDYAEIYKDITVEENVYDPTEKIFLDSENDTKSESDNLIENSSDDKAQLKSEHKDDDLRVISSWIVTIFVKNESKNSQFDYVCDGALVSEQYVLTGARCVLSSNTTFRPEDVIIIVGKKSLQGSSSNEKVIRISAIHIHENFTNENGKVQNELAVLQLEETVVLNEDIQIANLSRELTEDAEKSITTAWSFTGELKTIYYEKYENGSCHDKEAENMFCATYGNEVALCPSYGGLYAVKVEDSWFLQGIRSGDPTERGICFIKRIDYTTLDSYMDWIEEYLE